MISITQETVKNSRGEYIWDFVIDDVIWMSSDDHEIEDGERAIKHAKGDCFVAGLGLGLILKQLWEKSEVESITVCEINPEVIKKTKQHLLLQKWITPQQFDNTRFINDNAESGSSFLTKKYDFVYIDTYLEPNQEAKSQIKKITQNLKNGNCVKNNTVIDGWLYHKLTNE